MELQELIGIVKESGVAGAGGAGFPTYAKLDKRAEAIILNCAECEPLLKVHRQLLEKHAYEIMETFQFIGEVLEAKRRIIGVKEAYKATVNALKGNLPSFQGLELKLLPEIYPMGDEVVLIYEALGFIIPPGGIPIEKGVAVFNVETVYNIYKALHFRKPVTSKYLTIAGEVTRPVTVHAPIGMEVREVLQAAGEITVKNPVFIMGGPMTGSLVTSYAVVTKTTNAILVLDGDHRLVKRMQSDISIDMKRAMSICCQCEMCTDLCPRNLLGHPISPHMFMRMATSGVTKDLSPFLDTFYCCSCGVCELYACPQDLSPRRLITQYKNGLRSKGLAPDKKVQSKEPLSAREYRRIPMDRLTARLGLAEYNKEAPLYDIRLNPPLVKIMLSQHIGAKAVPLVNKGDQVEEGSPLAIAQEGKLSLPVHASIAGKVTEVGQDYIILQNSNERMQAL